MADETTQARPRRSILDAAPETAAPETAAPETAAPETAAPEPYVDVFAPPQALAVMLKAPENCAPMTIDGEVYAPGEDGLVEVRYAHVERAKVHGFTEA